MVVANARNLKANMEDLLGNEFSPEKAKELRKEALGGYRGSYYKHLERLDKILNNHGVESICERDDFRGDSAISYSNAGDTYDTTLLYVKGKLMIGCWGDVVEKGNYD